MSSAGQNWWLANAERRNVENPDDFLIPSQAERNSLVPGDIVKLVFRFTPPTDVSAERMWVQVQAVEGQQYVGQLTNEPRHIVGLDPGSTIRFGPQHVIDLLVPGA
jgi:hypothetical protein